MVSEVIQQVIKEMKGHPFTLVLILALTVFAAWGWTGYAKAADVESMKKEISVQLKNVNEKIKDNNDKIDRSYKLQLAESIRTLKLQICMVEDRALSESLTTTLDSLQEDYKDVNKNIAYNAAECDQK